MRVNKRRNYSLINQNSTEILSRNLFHNQGRSSADDLLRGQSLNALSLCNNEIHASSSYPEKENGDEIIDVDSGMPFCIIIINGGSVREKQLHLWNCILDVFTNTKVYKNHISTTVEMSEKFTTNKSRHLHLDPTKVNYIW